MIITGFIPDMESPMKRFLGKRLLLGKNAVYMGFIASVWVAAGVIRVKSALLEQA